MLLLPSDGFALIEPAAVLLNAQSVLTPRIKLFSITQRKQKSMPYRNYFSQSHCALSKAPL